MNYKKVIEEWNKLANEYTKSDHIHCFQENGDGQGDSHRCANCCNCSVSILDYENRFIFIAKVESFLKKSLLSVHAKAVAEDRESMHGVVNLYRTTN